MTARLRGRWIVLSAGGAALLLAAVLAVAVSRDVGAPELGIAETGFESATPFELPALDGGSFALADYAERPLFLYFWASWCAPCAREAPLIQQLWPEYEAAGYVFVGVNMLDGERDARAFATLYALTFPLVTDVAGTVYLDYGVYGLPESFFLRPGLTVQEKFIGELTETELRSMLDALVEGSPEAG